jgi:lysophospholipase L1-like esterase
MKRILLLLIGCVIGWTSSRAQETARPYDAAIRNFLQQDSLQFPEKGGILFIGSSSIGRWRDLEARLQEYPVIRRGFGGSTFDDILYYADQIIFPYRPSKIFLYAGENDLVQGKSVAEIMQTITSIHGRIKQRLPYTGLYIISTKPSIKLREYRADITELNNRIRAYIATQTCFIHFVDIHTVMLNGGEMPEQGLFVKDNLHLSDAGYDIWERVIRAFL